MDELLKRIEAIEARQRKVEMHDPDCEKRFVQGEVVMSGSRGSTGLLSIELYHKETQVTVKARASDCKNSELTLEQYAYQLLEKELEETPFYSIECNCWLSGSKEVGVRYLCCFRQPPPRDMDIIIQNGEGECFYSFYSQADDTYNIKATQKIVPRDSMHGSSWIKREK